MAESAVEPAAESTVPDPFTSLERAAAHLSSSSVKERISVFDASLASAVANEGEFKPGFLSVSESCRPLMRVKCSRWQSLSDLEI